MTKEYLIQARAVWVESGEHPGGKRDFHDFKYRNFAQKFEAPHIRVARLEAERLLAEFISMLPKKRSGSLSWQDADPTLTVTFSKVHKL